jgi:hypothetical protein
MIKDTGGPAFPTPGLSNLPNGEFIYPMTGMNLRDYFAAKAMAALITSAHYDSRQVFDAAKEAYFLADAMLEVRSKS